MMKPLLFAALLALSACLSAYDGFLTAAVQNGVLGVRSDFATKARLEGTVNGMLDLHADFGNTFYGEIPVPQHGHERICAKGLEYWIVW